MTDTSSAPTRRRENTRQRLLEAAAQVFAEVGLDAASVEAVCEAAGYTRGAFYSNFASKEELFLDLAADTAARQVEAVRARIAQITASGTSADVPEEALAIVREVLEAAGHDRLDVLLMGEIRNHALRNPTVAAAYQRQVDTMRAEVAQIILEIARGKDLRVRVPELAAADLFMTVWASAAEAAVMAGADQAGMRRRIGEALAVVAELVIDQRC
ncbi:TetR/AcrR family transcriptional regulator [Microbacterium sp. P04]|uniref:TetR/AcrR family transcriptional regulator n=1 Tax=Microbacterium sp. P04 TaxID=3366947 RepID=UPI003744F382